MNPVGLLWLLLLIVLVLAFYETFGLLGALLIILVLALAFGWDRRG